MVSYASSRPSFPAPRSDRDPSQQARAAWLLLRFVTTRGQECEIFVVGTPTRVGFAAVVGGGQPDLLDSVPTHHPDIGISLVFFGIDRPDRVSNPLPIRRHLRIPNRLDLRQIIQPNRSLPGLCFDRARNQQTHNRNLEASHDGNLRTTVIPVCAVYIRTVAA